MLINISLVHNCNAALDTVKLFILWQPSFLCGKPFATLHKNGHYIHYIKAYIVHTKILYYANSYSLEFELGPAYFLVTRYETRFCVHVYPYNTCISFDNVKGINEFF